MKKSPERPHESEFPSFFQKLKQVEDFPEIIPVGEKEQHEMECWIWEHLFKKDHLGQEGAWIYDHMQKTSEVLEKAGINTHDFEHVKTVMVNACLIFLTTQGLFLKDRYNLDTEEGYSNLLKKLFIIAISALFHDAGYLDCIEDEKKFSKRDLDAHARIGGEAIFNYGDQSIGQLLRRAKNGENESTSEQLIKKLLNTFFQPNICSIIEDMGQDEFYKNLRKIRAAITSHDTPDQQGGTEESTKTGNIPAEAAAVYLADKTHIGNRVRNHLDPDDTEIINNNDISVLHDRLTYLIKNESFQIEYNEKQTCLRMKLVVEIPESYQSEGYSLEKFKEEFKKGFEKRYTHTQKIFQSLMHKEFLGSTSTIFIVEAEINGATAKILEIGEPKMDASVKSLVNRMKSPGAPK